MELLLSFTAMYSETRLPTTRVPQGQNYKLVLVHAVVDEVPDAAKMQPTYATQARIADLDSSARLADH